MLIHARDNTRADFDVAKTMAGRLSNLDKVAEFVAIEFGGHDLENLEARKTILAALASFLARHNSDDAS